MFLLTLCELRSFIVPKTVEVEDQAFFGFGAKTK